MDKNGCSSQGDSSPDCEEDLEVYRIMVSNIHRTKPKARQAFHFIYKVKVRFSQEPDKIRRFFEIMDDHKRAQRLPPAMRPNAYDLFARIAELFEEENQDLLEELWREFMPPAPAGPGGNGGNSGDSGVSGASGASGASGSSSTSSISGATPPPS